MSSFCAEYLEFSAKGSMRQFDATLFFQGITLLKLAPKRLQIQTKLMNGVQVFFTIRRPNTTNEQRIIWKWSQTDAQCTQRTQCMGRTRVKGKMTEKNAAPNPSWQVDTPREEKTTRTNLHWKIRSSLRHFVKVRSLWELSQIATNPYLFLYQFLYKSLHVSLHISLQMSICFSTILDNSLQISTYFSTYFFTNLYLFLYKLLYMFCNEPLSHFPDLFVVVPQVYFIVPIILS